jgi:hypothetical protein
MHTRERIFRSTRTIHGLVRYSYPPQAMIIAFPEVGGMHHRYEPRAPPRTGSGRRWPVAPRPKNLALEYDLANVKSVAEHMGKRTAPEHEPSHRPRRGAPSAARLRDHGARKWRPLNGGLHYTPLCGRPIRSEAAIYIVMEVALACATSMTIEP